MTDVKQTVTRTEDQGVNENGAAVNQETKQIHTETAADKRTVAENIVWYVLGIIEITLLLRFALKLFGANPTNPFVDFVYSVSGVLLAPFSTIFGTASVTEGQISSVFEPSSLVAALVYALIAWGIAKLFNLNRAKHQ